jgi:hypothetical protein
MKFILNVGVALTCLLANATSYELFEVRGKVGLKDETGKILLPASFEGLGWSDGSFSVIGQLTGYKLNNQWGIVNLKKEFVTKPIYESLTNSGGYLLIASKKINAVDYKTGCVDLRGEVAIPFNYDGIKIIGLRAIVFKKEAAVYKFGLISLTNEIILPLIYANISAIGLSRFAVENDKGQLAMFTDQGNAVTPFSIDSVSHYNANYAVFHQGFMEGLLNRNGDIVVESLYRKIKITADGLVQAQLPSECKILSGDNQVFNKIEADGLTTSYHTLFKIKKGNLYGLSNDALATIFAPQYSALIEIGNDLFIAKKKKYGVINSHNKIILPLEFDSIIFDHHLFKAKEKSITKNNWVVYDTLGKAITKNKYEWIGDWKDNFFVVKKRGYWGAINSAGNELIHCVYDSLLHHTSNLFAVNLKGQYGIINTQEDWLMAPQPYPITLLKSNRILITKGNINYINDFAGSIIYFSEYTLECNTDFILEKLPNGSLRKIDYDGRVMASPSPVLVEMVETIFEESEGLRGMKKDGKFGFIDKKGNLRIANRYDAIGQFKEGLTKVKLNNKWGYINVGERIIIQPSFEQAYNFENGKALVKHNDKYGLINKEGKFILPMRYDSIVVLMEKNYILINNHKKGLANKTGQIIIEPKFDELTDLNNGYIIVRQDNKLGLITSEGLSTIPLIYDQLIYNPEKNNYLVMREAEWVSIAVGK